MNDESFDNDTCELCGERIDYLGNDPGAEMYDPQKPDESSVLCHGECGLSAGLLVA